MRINTQTATKGFQSRVGWLSDLHDTNWQKYRPAPSTNVRPTLSQAQMVLLTEGIFSNAFLAYEIFLEELFVLYLRGKPSISGKIAKSYLRPKTNKHAVELMQSSMPFLEWNSADNVLIRSELYFNDGFLIKPALTSRITTLREMRSIRNHIAHASPQSKSKFAKVVLGHLRALPTRFPSPGAFLLMNSHATPQTQLITLYLNTLREFADDVTC